MSEMNPSVQPADPLEDNLRADLAHGDAFISQSTGVLRLLLANSDPALFSDVVIARIRGMFSHCAFQMLKALADAGNMSDHSALFAAAEPKISAAMIHDTAFLRHAHALVIEASMAERLQQRSGIDPVLSPLLQELVASTDAPQSALAMQALAAQARFMQQQIRMELPLSELPGDLFHKALLILQNQQLTTPETLEAALADLRARFDEPRRRTSLITSLIATMERRAVRALEVDHAGLTFFVTALAMASDQPRELAVMALGENQLARFALSMRAAGLDHAAVEKQFLFLHPDIQLPMGFDRLLAPRAAALLAASDCDGG